MTSKPAAKPARPYFSSGPCAKPPGWEASKLNTESLGRSHRAKIGKSRLQYCIDLMREVLALPDTHRIGIVPGSDTGAFEMAMWTMLGARGRTVSVAGLLLTLPATLEAVTVNCAPSSAISVTGVV